MFVAGRIETTAFQKHKNYILPIGLDTPFVIASGYSTNGE